MVLIDTNVTKAHGAEKANEGTTQTGSVDEQIEELETELKRLNEKITDLCQLEQDWRSSLDQLASGRVSVEGELKSKQLGDGGEVDDCFGSSSSGESNTAISNGDDVRPVCSSTDDDFAYASDKDDDGSSSFSSWTTNEDDSYDAFSVQSDVAGFDDDDGVRYDIFSLSNAGPLQNGGSETDQEDEWDVFVRDRAYNSTQQYGITKQTQTLGEAEALLERIREADEYTNKVEDDVKSEMSKAASVGDTIASGEPGVEAEWDAIVSGESWVEAEWDDFVKERVDMQGSDVDGKKKKRFRGLRKLVSRIFRRKK